jgi:hypothetical protein
MIYSILKNSIYSAIENEENYDENGNINWNYVDADAYEDVRNFFKDDETFYEYFDDIAKGIIYEMEVNETSFQHEMTLH